MPKDAILKSNRKKVIFNMVINMQFSLLDQLDTRRPSNLTSSDLEGRWGSS